MSIAPPLSATRITRRIRSRAGPRCRSRSNSPKPYGVTIYVDRRRRGAQSRNSTSTWAKPPGRLSTGSRAIRSSSPMTCRTARSSSRRPAPRRWRAVSSRASTSNNADVNFTMDTRFSEYEGFLFSQMVYTTDGGTNQAKRGVIAKDDAVPRYRKHIIISEQTVMGQPILEKRVIWEKNRRMGRSQAVTCTVDSWRDTAGKLWAPNHLAPIKIPSLKLPQVDWCIGEVTYTRDEKRATRDRRAHAERSLPSGAERVSAAPAARRRCRARQRCRQAASELEPAPTHRSNRCQGRHYDRTRDDPRRASLSPDADGRRAAQNHGDRRHQKRCTRRRCAFRARPRSSMRCR